MVSIPSPIRKWISQFFAEEDIPESSGDVTIEDTSTAGNSGTVPKSQGDGTLSMATVETTNIASPKRVGSPPDATNETSVLIGDTAQGSGDNTVAIGHKAYGGIFDSTVAIGRKAAATDSGSTAVGDEAAAAETGVAIGSGADSSEGDSSISIGPGSTAKGTRSIAIGDFAFTNSFNGVAIGDGSQAVDASTAIGGAADAGGSDSIAVGKGATANSGAVAIGVNMSAPQDTARIGGVSNQLLFPVVDGGQVDDSTINNNEITFELDEANNNIVVKAKDSTGSLITNSL
jgi:hypothetical protein